MRSVTRVAVALGIVLSSSLVMQTGAQANTAQAIAANAALGVLDDPTATILTTFKGQDQFTTAKYATQGTVTSAPNVKLKGGVGMVANVGINVLASVGVGKLPGLGGLFGGSDQPAITFPAGGTTAPQGEVTGVGSCPQVRVMNTGANGTRRDRLEYSCSITAAASNTSGYYRLDWTEQFPAQTSITAPGVAWCLSPDRAVGASANCFIIHGPINGWYSGGTAGQSANYSSATMFLRNPATGGLWYDNASGSATYRKSQWDSLPTKVEIMQFTSATWSGSTANGVSIPRSALTATGAYAVTEPAGTTDNNPDRWVTATIKCEFPDGTVVTRTGNGATFKRSTTATGQSEAPPSPELECPDGSLLVEAGADIITQGSTTKVPLIQPWTIDPAKKADLLGPYADCLTTVCLLHVVRLVPELDCNSKAPAEGHPCQDWSKSSDLATNWQCKYGTHTVSMQKCTSLQNAYSASPTLVPNTGTSAPPAPVGTDPMQDPTPEQTPGLSASGCVPSGWNVLNPFAYAKAVGCVLKWAFVPPAGSFEANVSQVSGSWNASAPGAYLGGFGTMVGSFGTLGNGASGCLGPALTIEPLSLQEIHPISACEPPMSQVAMVVRLSLTLLVYVGAAIIAARVLAASFGLMLPAFGRED
jgi:hypothetical protein